MWGRPLRKPSVGSGVCRLDLPAPRELACNQHLRVCHVPSLHHRRSPMSPLHHSARTLVVLLALLSSFSGGEVRAQDAPVDPGSRVRVWTQTNARGRPWGKPTKGTLTAWTSDSLVLDSPRGPLAISRGSLSGMDVSRGGKSRGSAALKGAGVGFLIGAAAGTVGGLTFCGDECERCATAEGTAVFAASILGSAGGLWGAVIGALTAGERWERVPLPKSVSITQVGQDEVARSAPHRL